MLFLKVLLLDVLVLGRTFSIDQKVYSYWIKGERELLNGLQLRASAFHNPPCFSPIKTSTGSYEYHGICSDILIWLSEYYHMKLVYIPANLTEIITFGIVPVLIKQLLNKEVDIVPYAFAPTPELWKEVDFSIPLGIEYYNLLQQYPKEESRLTAIIRPFSFTVWVIFILSVVLMIIFMGALAHFFQESTNLKSKSFMNAVNRQTIYVMTVITGQGNHLSSKEKFALRLPVGLWCLTMIVLINAYSGTLTSYLTVPKLEPIVNTLGELSLKTKTKITSAFELEHTKIFLKATSGPYLVFGNTLRNNPQLLIKGGNIIGGMKNVLELGAAYFVTHVTVQYLMAMDMQSHSNCRMTASHPIPYMDYYSAGLPKGSRHNWIINHDFQYLWENGLLNYWLKKYTPNIDKCMTDKTKPSGRMTAFTFGDLSSAFAFLGIGIAISILSFILELISKLKKKNVDFINVF